jgi:hypothetical protein
MVVRGLGQWKSKIAMTELFIHGVATVSTWLKRHRAGVIDIVTSGQSPGTRDPADRIRLGHARRRFNSAHHTPFLAPPS